MIGGVEEGKFMWDRAVQCHQLMKNEYGEMGLPVPVRGKTQTADVIRKAAMFTTLEDVTDGNLPSLAGKLETPLLGPAAVADPLFHQVGGNLLMTGLLPDWYAPAVASPDSTGTSSTLPWVRLLDPQKAPSQPGLHPDRCKARVGRDGVCCGGDGCGGCLGLTAWGLLLRGM